MSDIRPVQELINSELFDFPGLAANPAANYHNAQQRDEYYNKRKHDAEIAGNEATHSLAILTIASEVDFNVLEVLDTTTQDAILAVRNASPQGLLAELAVRHHRAARRK
jgi:hypothetical protein